MALGSLLPWKEAGLKVSSLVWGQGGCGSPGAGFAWASQGDSTHPCASPNSPEDGVAQLGCSDRRGCIVSTPWVPQNYKELELLRQVYYGGVEHEIRKDVWPFLLGHYKFGMSKKEMEQVRGACSFGAGRWGARPQEPREGPLETSVPSS